MWKQNKLNKMMFTFYSIFLILWGSLPSPSFTEVWLIHYFKVYNTMTWHMHILWNDHHNKSSEHPSPHIVKLFLVMRTKPRSALLKTVKYKILTSVTMLYIIFPEVIYLLAGNVYLLTIITHFSTSYIQQPPICSDSVSSFFFRFYI